MIEQAIGVVKETASNEYVLQIVGLQPDSEGLRGKAPVAHGQNALAARKNTAAN